MGKKTKKKRRTPPGRFRLFANSFREGHSCIVARKTCNCLHHRKGTITRDKSQGLENLVQELMRTRWQWCHTNTFEPKRKVSQRGRMYVYWIRTCDTLGKACLVECTHIGGDSSEEQNALDVPCKLPYHRHRRRDSMQHHAHCARQ